MLTTRMLYFAWFLGLLELRGLLGSAGLRIQFSALRTFEVVLAPFEFNTLRLITVAPGAIPS